MVDLEQLYQQIILDHSRQRSGSGIIPADAHATSHQVNPTCGDEVTLSLKLTPTAEISEIVWEGEGCSISQASLSVLSQMVPKMNSQDREALIQAFTDLMHSRGQAELSEEELDQLGDLSAFAGVSKFPARVKCALLGWMALKDAVEKAKLSGTTEGPKDE